MSNLIDDEAQDDGDEDEDADASDADENGDLRDFVAPDGDEEEEEGRKRREQENKEWEKFERLEKWNRAVSKAYLSDICDCKKRGNGKFSIFTPIPIQNPFSAKLGLYTFHCPDCSVTCDQ